MKQKIRELTKDPYAWGCVFCGWGAVSVADRVQPGYMGIVVILLVLVTAWVVQKATIRNDEKRLMNAVEKGLIRVCDDKEDY